MRTRLLLLATTLAVIVLVACSQNNQQMIDGYYTAESSSYNADGWKGFITIYVSNNKIITVEYDAKNASGFIKSWDLEWMFKIKEQIGTYPSKYTRVYEEGLLNKQDPSKVNVIPGTDYLYDCFIRLATAAIEQAKKGDKRVAFIDLPERAEKDNN